MKIAVLRERFAGENRVALTPETASKLIALGATIAVETEAGSGSRIMDQDYVAAGAHVVPTAEAALTGAEIVLAVRRPDAPALGSVAPGALLIGAASIADADSRAAALNGVSRYFGEEAPVRERRGLPVNAGGVDVLYQRALLQDLTLSVQWSHAAVRNQAAGRTSRNWPLRPGRAPGQLKAKNRRQEVHDVLSDLHWFAFEAME